MTSALFLHRFFNYLYTLVVFLENQKCNVEISGISFLETKPRGQIALSVAFELD